MLRQLVVKGATIPAAGVVHPALVLTGTNLDGQPLPQWCWPGTDVELRAGSKLFDDMVGMAIRAADRANRGR